MEDKVDYGIGLSYRPSGCIGWRVRQPYRCQLYPPSQGLWIGPGYKVRMRLKKLWENIQRFWIQSFFRNNFFLNLHREKPSVCFQVGYGSVNLDQTHWIPRYNSAVFRNWIRIKSGQWVHPESGSGSRRTKNTNKNRKNKKFNVLKCWMFSFEDWRLLL